MVCVGRHVQNTKNTKNTKNNKFVISLQYLKKEVSDEVNFLRVDKNESFLQIDAMIFDGDGQAFARFPK